MRLKYVVLFHDGVAEPHYDLMLERSAGGPLATWRLAHWPPVMGDTPVQIADHRPAYLDYQGPVSGGRGHVKQVAKGTFQVQKSVDLQAGVWAVRLDDAIDLTLPVANTQKND